MSANPRPNPYRTHAFVSYSHKDQAWLDRLREVLAADRRNQRIGYWDDRELAPGAPWYQEILRAIDHARVAVLLVSPNFLASRFIIDEELPRILAAVSDGLTVLWIPLFGAFHGDAAPPGLAPLAALQAAAPVSTPLAELAPDSLRATLLDVCRRIQKLLHPAGSPRNLPFPSLGNLLKGRDDDLARLEADLRQTGAAAVVQPQSVTGMGGIGKTRLAVEYAWRHADDFTAFLFASAGSPNDLDANFAHLSEALDLPEYRFGKQDDQYAAVLRWLQQNPDWLLILDNVDTPEAVDAVKALVARLHGGQIVITSRIVGPKWGHGVRQIPLDLLPIPDAVAFLLESTAGQRPVRPDDDAPTTTRRPGRWPSNSAACPWRSPMPRPISGKNSSPSASTSSSSRYASPKSSPGATRRTSITRAASAPSPRPFSCRSTALDRSRRPSCARRDSSRRNRSPSRCSRGVPTKRRRSSRSGARKPASPRSKDLSGTRSRNWRATR